MVTRDLEMAKRAYQDLDENASISAHQSVGLTQAPERHSKAGGHLKSVVFGSLDGIITTFAVVAGATGGDIDFRGILILGFSNIFADALSMGVGDALSSMAEAQYVKQERARELWETQNYKQGEIDEMVQLYVSKGLPQEEAETVINIMAEHTEFFVDVMMVEEL